jgi:hypothetical protein
MLSILCEDIILYICLFLRIQDIHRFTTTCKKYYKLRNTTNKVFRKHLLLELELILDAVSFETQEKIIQMGELMELEYSTIQLLPGNPFYLGGKTKHPLYDQSHLFSIEFNNADIYNIPILIEFKTGTNVLKFETQRVHLKLKTRIVHPIDESFSSVLFQKNTQVKILLPLNLVNELNFVTFNNVFHDKSLNAKISIIRVGNEFLLNELKKIWRIHLFNHEKSDRMFDNTKKQYCIDLEKPNSCILLKWGVLDTLKYIA